VDASAGMDGRPGKVETPERRPVANEFGSWAKYELLVGIAASAEDVATHEARVLASEPLRGAPRLAFTYPIQKAPHGGLMTIGGNGAPRWP
jgi:hypothetical protein